MSLALIIAIILLGMAFIFVEFFLIPGGAFVGIVGFVIVAGGVFLAYQYRAPYMGHIFLAASVLGVLVLTIAGFKRVASLGWSDKESIDSKVNELEHSDIQPGDEGVVFNTLRPNGTAMIRDKRVEVYSVGEFVDKDEKVKVTKVDRNKIYVKPIKT